MEGTTKTELLHNYHKTNKPQSTKSLKKAEYLSGENNKKWCILLSTPESTLSDGSVANEIVNNFCTRI